MPKLRPQMVSRKSGERKLNCYNIAIPRYIAECAQFTERDMLVLSAKAGKITIRRAHADE